MSKLCRISYENDPYVSFKANLIRSWARGDIPDQIMSASSGPKDYVKNHIWAIFDSYPLIKRVLMLQGEYTRSAPFLLVENAAGEVWDMAGKAVVMTPKRAQLEGVEATR